jgi:replicative DNA helicase
MKPLPHNREAEAAVLAGILLRNEALDGVAAEINAESFYVPKHKAVWRAMVALAERGEPIDPVTLEHQLRATSELGLVGGLEGLGKLSDRYANSHRLMHHVAIVATVAAQRRLVECCERLAEEGREMLENVPAWIDEAQRQVIEASAAKTKKSYRPINAFLHTEFDLTARQAIAAKQAKEQGRPIPLTGLRTGLERLDQMTCGLQPADLIILAARPSMGKTALAMQIAENVAADGEPVLVASLEMSGGSLTRRMMFSVGRLNATKFREGRVLDGDMQTLVRACERITKLPISIDDRSGLSIREMKAAARRWRKDPEVFPRDGKKRTGLMLVDYIQLAEGEENAERRDIEIGQITKGLKGIAKELELPVLALSQLNRGVDSRADHRPQLGDLRESGNIEQDADVIMFIYREARYLADDHPEKLQKERDAEVIIGKQRNGEIGTAHLVWMGEHTRFENSSYHR